MIWLRAQDDFLGFKVGGLGLKIVHSPLNPKPFKIVHFPAANMETTSWLSKVRLGEGRALFVKSGCFISRQGNCALNPQSYHPDRYIYI